MAGTNTTSAPELTAMPALICAGAHLMDIAFLLMQSPAARPSQEVQKVVGITHFNCSFWFGDLSQTRVLKSMELFAKEVMPAIA